MSTSNDKKLPQEQGLVGYKRPPKEHQFKPGKDWRGNPGGRPKGTPRVDVAYAKLLAMTPDEIRDFEPRNGAEILAYEQFKRACISKNTLPYAQEIADRVDGPVDRKVKVTDQTEVEKERVRFETAIEILIRKTGCSRMEAAIALASINESYKKFLENA